MKINKFRVIHLVRKVSPTSMPWNDLYRTHRLINRHEAAYMCSISKLKSPGLCFDMNSKQRYFCLNFITAFYAFYKIVAKNKRNNIGIIIHIHNMSIIPYIFFLRLLDVKLVLNIHNSLVNFNFLQYNLLKLGLPFFDAIISVSNSVGDEVIRTFPSIKQKAHSIPNGIHIDQLMKVNDLRSYNTKKNIDVIVVARLVKQKNVPKVLSVISECKNLKKVVWYGQGDEMIMARSKVEKGALASVLEFKGIKPRQEVLEAINKSIIYLSLSKWEGLGVANLEALSLPTEVVLSDIPPHRELLSNNNLKLVDLETSDKEIAAIIDSKIVEYKQRGGFLLARSATTRVRYDLRLLVGKYIDVYNELINN